MQIYVGTPFMMENIDQHTKPDRLIAAWTEFISSEGPDGFIRLGSLLIDYDLSAKYDPQTFNNARGESSAKETKIRR